MNVSRTSTLSGKVTTMDLNVTTEQLERFNDRYRTGEYVQNIFSDLPAPEREFILSGITPDEWTELFGSHED